MTIEQALNILKVQELTDAGLKSAYRQFVKTYHPDVNPNGTELMKMGNIAYEFLVKTAHVWGQEGFQKQWNQAHGKEPEQQSTGSQDISGDLNEIFIKIKHFEGIQVTLSGVWLWVTGNTYHYKSAFKDLGFAWCPKKKAWAWKPEDQKRHWRKRPWDFDQIYERYGRVDLETEQAQKL